MTRKVYYFNKELQKVVERGGEEDMQSFHAVHQDTMDPIVSMATDEGLVFTSRSAYKRHLKMHGFEVTGGSHILGEKEQRARIEAQKAKRRADIKHDIEVNLNKLKWGMIPLSEKEKHICQQEERAYREYKKRQN